jgi:hypothetical protein
MLGSVQSDDGAIEHSYGGSVARAIFLVACQNT